MQDIQIHQTEAEARQAGRKAVEETPSLRVQILELSGREIREEIQGGTKISHEKVYAAVPFSVSDAEILSVYSGFNPLGLISTRRGQIEER